MRLGVKVMKRNGFTLIEIIVSLALLGIIAVATLPLLTFGYVHLFESNKYTVDTFDAQQLAEQKMEELRTRDITPSDPSTTLTIFGKSVKGHLVKMDIGPSGTPHGEINVFVPKYKVVYTVPVVKEGDVVVTAYRDGVLIPEDEMENMFPLARPTIGETPGSYITLKGSEPEVTEEEFLMNVYRWYMSPVSTAVPNKRDLILIKEWNAAKKPLSFADSEDLTFVPNVEADYDILDFREFYSHLGLTEAELCEKINERFSGRFFYYSVTPYSTIGRIGVEEFSQELVSTNMITAIDDITETIPVGLVYYPNDHYPSVPAQMFSGDVLNVPVVWSPAAINITEPGENVSHGTVVGFPEGVDLTLTVQHVPVTGVSIIPATHTMNAGETYYLTPDIEPDEATNQSVTWASSSPAIATVNGSGMVTAVGVGTVTVTVTTVDGGFTGTCTITVNPAPLISISISGDPHAGSTLSSVLDPATAAPTAIYQWQRADALAGPYQNISGAAASTYTLKNADAGKYIRVVATGTGSYTGTVTSAGMLISENNTEWVSASGYASSSSVSNPIRAYASDNSYAVFNNTGDSVDYTFTGAAFPANATVTGIEIKAEAKKDVSQSVSIRFTVRKGSNSGTAYTTSNLNQNTDTEYTFGSPSNLGGFGSWTPAEIQNNLRIRTTITANRSVSLDHLQIRVHYQMPE